MNTLVLLLSAAILAPIHEVAPVPCETEEMAIEVARSFRPPETSRWVMKLGKVWDGKQARVERFRRPWSWRLRRTAIRFEAVAADFKVTVNGKATGESKGFHGVVEFDITDALKWFGENTIDIRTGDPLGGNQTVFRRILLVSTSRKSPKLLRAETSIKGDYSAATFRIVDEKGNELKRREVPNPQFWSDETPTLCMTPIETKYGWWKFSGIEYRAIMFGLVRSEVEDGKLRLNGSKIKLRVAKKGAFTPGAKGRSTSPSGLAQDIYSLKYMNFNAVLAKDMPKIDQFYDFCDRDGLIVLAAKDDVVPAGHASVMPLEGLEFEAIEVPRGRKEIEELRNHLAQVEIGKIRNGLVKIENKMKFLDLEKFDGWTCVNENGKDALTGKDPEVKKLAACAPGKEMKLDLSAYAGKRFTLQLLKDEDVVVSRTFGSSSSK